MVLFARKSADDTDAGKPLVDDSADAVEFLLDDLIADKCHPDDGKKRDQKQRRSDGDDHGHRCVQDDRGNDTAERDKRGAEHQSDKHRNARADLIDVRRHRHVQKRNAALFLLGNGKRIDLRQKPVTKARADTRTCAGSAVLADRRGGKSHRRHAEHQKGGPYDKTAAVR